MAKVANLKSSIQSKIQKDVTSLQQKTASSTQATQAGSTVTPEVTSTPKVTQTAKAMPSITRPDISQIATPTVSQTTSTRDLFAPSTTPTLRKADTTNLLNTNTERKEITKTALPTSLVRAADTQGGAAKETVDKTLMEQFSDWFKETPEKVTNKVGDFFKGPVMSFGTSFERMINDTEYWVAGLADVIETSLGGEGGFKQAFQEQQGWYWDAYGEENDIKASKLYEQDTQAQNVSRDVSDYIWTVTGNKEMSDMIGNVVGKVTASLKDPEQIASVAGYMTPALIMQWATGGGFLTNTAIWLPSQSTNVYKDFSEDKELSSQFTDNQLFGISTGLGTVLSMVETFGDALGDMPWAKAMSRSIRNAFTKSLKKPIAEGLTKEITDVVDRNLIKDIKQPVLNALKKWYLGSIGEGLEEVTQDTLQTEGARALGSKREGMSLEQMLTTYFTAKGMGLFISGPGAALNIKNNSDLKKQYDEFSKTVDKVSPGINEDTKMAFFSAMITSQQNDANLSEKKVKEYEEQTTKLYEEKSMLEQRLKQADNDEVRAKINGMIEQTDNKIKEIDKKINQWNNTRDEINKYIEERNNQKEIEEIYESANKESRLYEEGGKNLSEQTMRDAGIELGGGVKNYQTKTPEFKNWFKDSQVVDKEGNPLVVYHGTRHNITVPNMKKGKEFAYGGGMYFTTNKEGAEHYSESKKGLLDYLRKPRVMEVYLSIQNPIKQGVYKWDNRRIEELKNLGYKVNEEYLSREDVSVFDKYFNLIMMQDYKKLPKLMEDFSRITGYDGLMVEQPNGEQYWIAFRPEQVKSATDNIGTFDINDSNIKRDISYHLPSTGKDYESFAEALKQPQNDILKKLPISDLIKIEDGATSMRASATPELVKSLDFVKSAVQKELEERYNKDKKPEETKPAETIEEPSTFKDAEDYIQKMLDYEEKKAGHELTDREKDRLRKKYSRNFLRKNLEGDFSRHMVGLKGVNLKQIEGELTDERLADIANMLALVSDTFGVDFNKLIADKNLSLNIAQNVGTYLDSYGTIGIMLPKNTKDKLRELLISKGLPPALAEVRGENVATAGVAISLKDGLQKAGETMAHELWHFIDFATSLEEGLPLRLVKDSSGTHIDYTSIIAKQRGWRTFNLFDVKKGDDYYDDPSEILARYAEQYFAYIHDNESFKELAYTKEGYWTPEEFEKLLPKFEALVRGRVGGKILDKGNEFYYDVMNRIRDNKFARISEEFDRGGLFKSDVKQRIEFMKEEYAFIMSHINEMTGTLKEEMETYVQLSNLQQNYEMAKAKGEEYLKMLETTPEQQSGIDTITQGAIPNQPEAPEALSTGIPYMGSNIENGIGQIAEGNPEGQNTLNKSYIDEKARTAINKKNRAIKTFFVELGQTFYDIFTPAISRIYNISPRVAGRLITMEAQTDINIHRYREKAKGFVKSLGNLKGKKNEAKLLEVKKALLDYGALASEQGENIEQYKKEEVAKLKEVLLRNGFKEKDITDMFYVLDDIGRQYQEAGLSITLSDMYFPRLVTDYEGLIDYMSRVSGQDIALNKVTLLNRIREIQNSDKSDAEKEKAIRWAITNDFKQPGTTSQNAKERKIGKLSDWGDGIYAYYANPIEALDHYIVSMTNAIQRQLFLGGMKQDSDYEGDILNDSTTESISKIIDKLVEDGMISSDDLEELKHTVLSVLNKKKSPKWVTATKNITYITTITNFLSALNQLDDLGMAIIKDKSGLKNVVKSIFNKADIKYDELGLDDAYEMFREEGKMINWLFSKSFFNAIDRLGKTSFVNAAWESLIRQYSNEKTREYLHTRLVSMYGEEAAKRMEEKIKSKDYKGEDGQIDIEILRDLLYQLGSTQPIFTSAMPTAYLNHPLVRLCYALSSFTIKRIDWLVQGTKEVNAKHGKVAAGAWLMGVTFYLALFGAAVGDIGDWLKGKKEETFLWQFIENGIEDALKTRGEDMLTSWLKIWDLSEYDLKIYQWQGLKGVVASKIAPFIFDLGDDVIQAIWKHDLDEATDLVKYIPIFGKLVYYNCLQDIGKETKKKKDEWDFSGEEEWDFGGGDEWDFSGEEEWDFS